MRALVIFATVCEHRNLTLSAELLKLPKSTVSKEVSKLELHFGTKLLLRSTRKVEITEAGQIVYERALQLVNEFKSLQHDVHTMEQQVHGLIKLSAPPALGGFLAREIIPAFLKRWPQVRIDLNLTDSIEDLFAQGIDAAFRVGPVRDDRLIRKHLGIMNRVLVASPAYISNHDAISHPQDLINHNCLRFLFTQNDTEWTLISEQKSESLQVTGNFFCSSVDALKHTALEGVGIAQIPFGNVRHELEQGCLVRVLPEWSSLERDINLLYRTGLNKPKKLTALIEYLEEKKALFNFTC